MHQNRSSKGKEKWSDSGYIFKKSQQDLLMGWRWRVKSKAELRTTPRLHAEQQKDRGPSLEMGGEGMKLNFEHVTFVTSGRHLSGGIW